MKVRVFTDGACSRNGKAGAEASYACWFPEHKEYSTAGRVPATEPQTNNRGELMAIYEAVLIAEKKFSCDDTELTIYTDSTYSRDCLTKWHIGWIERTNWTTTNGKPVVNRDIIEVILDHLPKFKSHHITYVAAHTGKSDEFSKNNDIVDKMAVAVLNPEVVYTNQESPIESLPISLMGPPVSGSVLTKWCYDNLDKLDKDDLENALLNVLTKTLKKKGLNLEKQKLHRSHVYRLLATDLIVENK